MSKVTNKKKFTDKFTKEQKQQIYGYGEQFVWEAMNGQTDKQIKKCLKICLEMLRENFDINENDLPIIEITYVSWLKLAIESGITWDQPHRLEELLDK